MKHFQSYVNSLKPKQMSIFYIYQHLNGLAFEVSASEKLWPGMALVSLTQLCGIITYTSYNCSNRLHVCRGQMSQ